jgi:flagellar FliL protein
MAKQKQSKPAGKSTADSKLKSARFMLIFAVLLSVSSLGGGYYFARSAFQQDSELYEQKFVPEDGADAPHNEIEGVIDPAYPEQASDNGHDSSSSDDHASSSSDGHSEDTSQDGVLDFDSLTTNITTNHANGDVSRSFLKLSIMLIYATEPGAKKHLIERQPFIRDLFNVYIRSLSENDLRGAAGILSLKSELLKRARAAAGNETPTEILINDLIVN